MNNDTEYFVYRDKKVASLEDWWLFCEIYAGERYKKSSCFIEFL